MKIYRFIMEHITGVDHQPAPALSRLRANINWQGNYGLLISAKFNRGFASRTLQRSAA
jgi:hypothetical protein